MKKENKKINDFQFNIKEDNYFNYENENNSNKIKVEIPNLVKTLFSNHYEYEIKINENDKIITIKRRFKEILLLYEKLKSTFIGIFIPFPHIKEKNKSCKFLVERRFYLEYFFNYIKNRKILYYSNIFQCFMNNQKNLKEALNKIRKLEFEDTCKIYEKSFENFYKNKNYDILEQKEKLENIELLINNKKELFINIKSKIKKFIFNDLNNNMIKYLNDLNKKNKNNKNLENLKSFQTKTYKIILRKFKFIILDIENFLDIIKNIKELENFWLEKKLDLNYFKENLLNEKNFMDLKMLKLQENEVKDYKIYYKILIENLNNEELKIVENNIHYKYKKLLNLIINFRLQNINYEENYLSSDSNYFNFN